MNTGQMNYVQRQTKKYNTLRSMKGISCKSILVNLDFTKYNEINTNFCRTEKRSTEYGINTIHHILYTDPQKRIQIH